MPVSNLKKFSLFLSLAVGFLLGRGSFAIQPDQEPLRRERLERLFGTETCEAAIRHLEEARYHFEKQDIEKARAAIRIFREHSHLSSGAHQIQADILYAETLLTEGQSDEALAFLKKTFNKFKNYPTKELAETAYLIGWISQDNQDLNEALAYYNKAAELQPDDILTQAALGGIYESLAFEDINSTGHVDIDYLNSALKRYKKVLILLKEDPARAQYIGDTAINSAAKLERHIGHLHEVLDNGGKLPMQEIENLMSPPEEENYGGTAMFDSPKGIHDFYESLQPIEDRPIYHQQMEAERNVIRLLWEFREHPERDVLEVMLPEFRTHADLSGSRLSKQILRDLEKLRQNFSENELDRIFDKYLYQSWTAELDYTQGLLRSHSGSAEDRARIKGHMEELFESADDIFQDVPYVTAATEGALGHYRDIEEIVDKWPDASEKKVFQDRLKIREAKIALDEWMIAIHRQTSSENPYQISDKTLHKKWNFLTTRMEELENNFDRLELSEKWRAAYILYQYHDTVFTFVIPDDSDGALHVLRNAQSLSRKWIREAENYRDKYEKFLKKRGTARTKQELEFVDDLSPALHGLFQHFLKKDSDNKH